MLVSISRIRSRSQFRTGSAFRAFRMLSDLSTVFMKAMQDWMLISSSSRPLVAPPMARVNASPLRKWVDVRGLFPVLSVVLASALATSWDSAPLIPTAMMR